MYEIKVLDNKEFERLPYKNLETALGVADPKTKRGYVRYTGLKELDQHLVTHELEHLQEGGKGKYSKHYRDGVYYKDAGGLWSSIGSAIGPAMMMTPATMPLGLAITAGGAGGQFAGAKRQQKEEQSQQQQQMSQMGQGQMAQGPLNMIQAPASPNIVSTGGSGQAPVAGNESKLGRIQGFFSGRAGGM